MSDNEQENSGVPAYKAGEKVSIDQLLSQDAQDESLRKYKESLLGKETFSPKDDPRKVVIKEMRIIFESRPAGNEIVYPLDTKELLETMKKTPFVLKESCHYKIALSFNVQHEIVSGLKQINTVYRKGVRVSKDTTMLGSFGPQAAPHIVTNPRHGWDDAPSGLLARGSYTAKVQFVDDDNHTHFEAEYAFSIKSDWKD